MNNRGKILAYMKKNPGVHFNAAAIAKHFSIPLATAKQALKDEARCNRLLSVDKKPMVDYFYPAEAHNHTHVGMTRDKKLSLAEKVAIDRCRELYPADMQHFTLASNVPNFKD